MISKYDKIKKWSPIIKNIGVINDKLIEYICIYCEDYCLNNPDKDDVSEKLKDLLLKLSKENIEVVKTYYNPVYGKVEYELSNGLIVDEFNKFNKELTTQNLIELFGINFVRELDIKGFRDNRLNDIIDG